MKLGTKLKIFKWKIIAGSTVLIILILGLITFGVYVKVRSLSSFMIMEQQAAIAAQQATNVEQMSNSLSGMEAALIELNLELRDVRKELCLQRDHTGESCQADNAE
jgi:hypothetical protein